MIVKQGQSFFDMVLQGTGNIDNAFEMAVLNNRIMTDCLEIGDLITPSEVTDKRITSLFNANNLPATALADRGGEYPGGFRGIGEMIIGSTFIVG